MDDLTIPINFSFFFEPLINVSIYSSALFALYLKRIVEKKTLLVFALCSIPIFLSSSIISKIVAEEYFYPQSLTIISSIIVIILGILLSLSIIKGKETCSLLISLFLLCFIAFGFVNTIFMKGKVVLVLKNDSQIYQSYIETTDTMSKDRKLIYFRAKDILPFFKSELKHEYASIITTKEFNSMSTLHIHYKDGSTAARSRDELDIKDRGLGHVAFIYP
ncbi:hypothetical protein dsat_2131 [Alkalidesulfovibrio alkalitolerans DSM 16529]|uniref:Uncharacterized protein n=1 Tax=Alkalidesulfovibrio alkalitolerans DSM 16529 TaxID=1121439 RepID=S7TFQ5_9BACT|nr:hypothetical protein [Alkalidesulfovibrio alkalitolerans]EPR35430.1 hypothetical protein dsat_2131 [Alkalidesulfovibrio alkalitolerans DSM 16529]